MDGKLQVTIVTPEQAVLERTACDSLTLPAEGGEIQVLPGHAALVTLLGIGVSTWRDGGRSGSFALKGGFAEIASDEVRVLADAAVAPETVDADRARREKDEAERQLLDVQGEEQLVAVGDDVLYAEARLSLVPLARGGA